MTNNNMRRFENSLTRTLITSMSVLTIATFFAVIVFVIYSSIPGIQKFGISAFFTSDFVFNKNEFGIWKPLLVTIFIAFFAVLIANFISTRVSYFVHFRTSKKAREILKTFFLVLSGLPSVVYGVFAQNSISPLLKVIFSLRTEYNLISAVFILSIMIMPSLIAFILISLEGSNELLMSNVMVLGRSKTDGIYKVYKKAIRKYKVTAILVCVTRAIGETMALSMILQSENYISISTSLVDFLNSNPRTLSVVIGGNVFGENIDQYSKGVLFFFGIVIFFIVFLINVIATIYIKRASRNKIGIISGYTSKLKYGFTDFTSKFVNYKSLENVFNIYRVILETISLLIFSWITVWIITDISINGIASIVSVNSTLTSIKKDSTGQSLVFTLMILFITLVISFPLSLILALFVCEYLKNKKVKGFINFLLDAMNSTPSIIFGLFGLYFFLNLLQISSNGSKGTSVIAGCLTLSIVVIPTITKSIMQSLISIGQDSKHNAMALGLTQWQVMKMNTIPSIRKSLGKTINLASSKIVSETAPLFITAGLVSSSAFSIFGSGQTLTTRVYYYSVFSNDSREVVLTAIYEAAFISLIIGVIILLLPKIIKIIGFGIMKLSSKSGER
jgi:phosphate transport system permease protein